MNVSVQAARSGPDAENLIDAADSLDRISAQTREAAQKLADLATELEGDIHRVMESGWSRFEMADSPAVNAR